jgi:murein hydrolase activator
MHLRAVLATVGAQVSARTAKLRAALAQARRLENEVTRLAERRRAVRASLRARHADLAALAAAEQLKARRAAGAAGDEAARALLLARRSETPSALAGRVDGARTRAAAATQPAVSARAPANGPDRMPVSGEARVGPGEGVAIAARPGALVVAPGSGRVAFAGPYRGFGGIVIIEHDGGWTSLVTGLARAEVVAGQRLVAGSPLGRASGGASRVGLELWRNGRRVNPLDQLR